VNALRGHSNVQGVTDMNAYAEVFSGYLSAPTDNDDTYEKYLKRCTPKPMRPNQFNYWSNFPRFFNSLMKSYYGKAATPESNFCYDWVPKLAGGFDVLKDVPKTLVFKLCEYRNSVDYVIPQRVIDRPPSAELAPDQVDQDSLPPYDILDAILKRYVEEDASVADMVAEGFEEAVVRKVVRLVDLNEYKRRQAAVGPRITARNFGKDRRYPITSGFGKQNW